MTDSEPGRHPPTFLEDDDRGGRAGLPPTYLEGAPDHEEWNPLRPSLKRRFAVKRELQAGGEAAIYLVSEREGDGSESILKIYSRRGEDDALQRVVQLSRDHPQHLVGILECGVVVETGNWYELQEYLPLGTLHDLVTERGELHEGVHRLPPGSGLLQDVIAEIHHALVAFHAAGLAHQDIKPTNVFVRSVEPRLDLVLGDFGLAVASRHTVFLSKRMGTPAYDSPESQGAGQGGAKRDFWALGMTIAHLAGGRHPFSDPSAPTEMLDDKTIRDHLFRHHPIDLSAIEDPRVQQLCAGLTRYHEGNRWGAEQVAQWLDGGDPEVLADQAPTSGGMMFAGAVCATRADLAAAMLTDWRAAVGVLGTVDKRSEFLDQVSVAFGGAGLDEIESRWAERSPRVDEMVADLVAALGPVVAEPKVNGVPVARSQLAGLAREVASGSERATGAIKALYGQHRLTALSAIPGHESLRDLDQQWRKDVQRYRDILRQSASYLDDLDPGELADRPADQAILLAMVADPDFAKQEVTRRDAAVDANPDVHDLVWFTPLAGATVDDPGAVLAAKQLAGLAGDAARQERREAELTRRLENRRLLTQVGLANIEAPADTGDDQWRFGELQMVCWVVAVVGLLIAVLYGPMTNWAVDLAGNNGLIFYDWARALLQGWQFPTVVPLLNFACAVIIGIVAIRTNNLEAGGSADFTAAASATGVIVVASLPFLLGGLILLLILAGYIALGAAIIALFIWVAAMALDCS